MGYSLYAELKRRVGFGGRGVVRGVGWGSVGWLVGIQERWRVVGRGGGAEGGDSRLFSRPQSPG